ncbi:MAG TPA: hypothetical protein VNA15_02750 [Candidatus Angelobacter sp.]|nr:hypothetical protein [Candidatus Angelobacter sp.]
MFYFLILTTAIGSGIGAAAVFKRFNTTTAPFEDIFNLTGGEFNSPITLLIIGDSGPGASTLGLQLLYRQLSAGRSCGLLTYDSFPSEIQKRMGDMAGT